MNIEIKVITAKVRQFIEIEEREALVGTIKFGRPAFDHEQEKGGRFARKPNFAIPGLCPDRPISVTGHVAMHFKHTLVVKKARYGGTGPRSNALILTGDSDGFETDAADHERYISREGAVMAITAAAYDEYIEAGGLEKRGAIFTNIDPDLEKRVAFWNAVARRERKPSPDLVTFYPDRLTPDQWKALLADYDGHSDFGCPPEMRRIEAASAPVELQLEFREFTKLRKQLKRMDAWDKDHPAIIIKRGRGGRVQRRMVGELPAGLDSAAHVRIARQFGSWLEELGMMYTVVVHAPDHHNDKRNFHLHVAAYDRPCRYLHEHGCWDFDHRVEVKGQHKRTRAPFRQNKRGSLTRPADGKNFRKHGAVVMSQFREKFAELCNAELKELGINRLFDHRSYAAMGIEQKPGRHLGTKAASLEAAGVPTTVGIENAENSWQGAFHRAAVRHNVRRRLRADCRDHAADTVDRLNSEEVASSVAKGLRGLIVQLDALQGELGDHELDLEQLYLTVQMAHSRSEKTWDVCQRLLEVIEAGGGTPAQRDEEDEIRTRQKEAQEHSDRVDAAIDEELLKAGEFANHVHFVAKKLDDVMEKTRVLIDRAEQELASRAAREVGAYFEAPLDYEEEWDNAFLRIQLAGLEIKAPSERIAVFHVPGIGKADLVRLTNPIFQRRSQARLQAMYKFQELNKARAAARMTARAAAVERMEPVLPAEETVSVSGEFSPPAAEGPDHLSSDSDHSVAARPPVSAEFSLPPELTEAPAVATPQPAIVVPEAAAAAAPPAAQPKPDAHYDELARKAREEWDRDRAEAVSEWFDWFKREFDGRPLPVRFEGPQLVLDINQLPQERRRIPDTFSAQTIELVRHEVNAWRELMRVLLLGSSRSMVQFRNGKAIYNPKDFEPSVRPHLGWLLGSDPVVRGYANQANLLVTSPAALASAPAMPQRSSQQANIRQVSRVASSTGLSAELLAHFQKGRGAER